MAILLDDITRKKLILVRQLFQRAVIQAEVKHSFVDRILALITFDLANETLIKILIKSLDSRANVRVNFHELIALANQKLASVNLSLIPDERKIKDVHDLRNDAQHRAKYPNETDVSDCRTYTRDFLRQLILNVWNEHFDSISLIDLIQNEEVKNHLVEAKSHIKNGEYSMSIGKSDIALDSALSKIKNSIVGYIPFENEAFVVSDGRRRTEADQKTYQSFLKLRDLTVRSLVGLNLSEYVKYSQLVGSVVRLSDGFIFSLSDYKATEQEAEFVLNYVTDSLIRIENLVGDIKNPFNF